MAGHEDMSRSFGAAAAAYEVGRPEYPDEAVEWMLQPARTRTSAPRVADVGAGTGKLTRVALRLGAQMVAVDPDPQMLETLRAHVAGVPTLEGTAEDLPLDDGLLDGVILGQAWHWVDPLRGSAETARVLRPGGVLGLIWNIRDESIPWVRRLTEVMTPSNAETMIAQGGPEIGQEFAPIEHRSWRWSRPMTRASLLAMARSRSHVITAEASRRERLEADLAALFDDMGAVDDAVVELPYITEAFRAVRL